MYERIFAVKNAFKRFFTEQLRRHFRGYLVGYLGRYKVIKKKEENAFQKIKNTCLFFYDFF